MARMKVVEPLPEPMYCWCVDYWIKVQHWQNSMDPEMLCRLFAATVLLQ